MLELNNQERGRKYMEDIAKEIFNYLKTHPEFKYNKESYKDMEDEGREFFMFLAKFTINKLKEKDVIIKRLQDKIF